MNCELIFGRISELFTHHLNSPDRQLNFLKIINVKINFKIRNIKFFRITIRKSEWCDNPKKISSDSFKRKYNLERILTEVEINKLISSFNYGLDFYFPYMEHRKSWKSNINQILMAYPPLSIDDNESEKIVAFTLNGNAQILCTKIPAIEPVLFIYPCEHYGDHSIENNTLLKKTLSTSSGIPYTPVLGKLKGGLDWREERGEPYIIIIDDVENSLLNRRLYGTKNSVRFPAYHRLDISLTRNFYVKNHPASFTFQILNAYNNNNPFYYDLEVSTIQISLSCQPKFHFTNAFHFSTILYP